MAAQHIVMFPFPAQGHLIPLTALAKLIERRTSQAIIFTIVSTPLNIPTIQSSLPPNTTIRLASLPFNSSHHGLPPNSENTDSLPFYLIPKLLHASQSLQPSFEHFVISQAPPVSCIISDVFLGWTVEIARRLKIYHAVFNTCGGYGTAAYSSLWLHLPHTKTDSDEFSLPGLPDSIRIHRTQMSSYMAAADGNDPWSVFLRRQISFSLKSDAMLCNSVEEMEKTGLGLMRRFTGLPVWCVGPLLPPSFLLHPLSSSSPSNAFFSQGRTGKEPGISAASCIEWLNLHRPCSVLYISFGSQNTITAPQMMELAAGLESSGQDFIWVIRPPVGFDINGEIRAEWLPEGFEERVKAKKKGILVRRWAPQLDILARPSTGAFLSHCGWNSVLESLSQGVPIIGWPLASEQFYNSKMMEEEMGVCVEITRGSIEINREKVETVIEEVMGGAKKGVEMRRKALEVRVMIKAAMIEGGEDGKKGSSIMAVDDFIATATRKKGCGYGGGERTGSD